MVKNKPVIIWIIKHNPNNDPKFHKDEIFDGVGKSINELFIILIIGCVFRNGLYIFIINELVKVHN